jgi:hypothetical protein
MYPDQPNRNEFSLKGENALDALSQAVGHFRNEEWRTQGTFFEVREDREDGSDMVILRAILSDT